MPDGPRSFHSLVEDDSCSCEVDKLSSDSDLDPSSSDEELDSADDSASIFLQLQRLRLSSVAYFAFLWNLSSGFHREECHVGFPLE